MKDEHKEILIAVLMEVYNKTEKEILREIRLAGDDCREMMVLQMCMERVAEL
jgi:hypothetical protein